MTWPHSIACFFAGAILANAVPHFVNGVSGDPFPTPFSKPPGKGLSSPLVNVVWALFNLVVGAVLFRAGQVSGGGRPAHAVFFAGVAAISILSSVSFAKKHPRWSRPGETAFRSKEPRPGPDSTPRPRSTRPASGP